MIIRPFEIKDTLLTMLLQHDTIYALNAKDYSEQQLAAWSARRSRSDVWALSMLKNYTYVAEDNERVVGFGDLSLDAQIHRLYVTADCQGRGIGKQILRHLEDVAKAKGFTRLTLDSTLTAHEFYRSQNYVDIEKSTTLIRGVSFEVYRMKKELGLQDSFRISSESAQAHTK